MGLKHHDWCASKNDGRVHYTRINATTEVKRCGSCGADLKETIKFKMVALSKLAGPTLKYAVAVAEGHEDLVQVRDNPESPIWVWESHDFGFDPDTDPELFYSLLIKHRAWITPPVDDGDDPVGWDCSVYSDDGVHEHKAMGHPTPAIALCHAIVQKYWPLGGKIAVPARLLEIK